MLEWEEFLAQLRRLNSVALRVEYGEGLVETIFAEKLASHGGRLADMDETKVFFDLLKLYSHFLKR